MATLTISGGKALEAKLRELSKKVAKASTLSVGFLEGATYPSMSRDETRDRYAKKRAKNDTSAIKGETGGQSVAMVAAIQEYGAPKAGIPPRPFFRTMVAAKQDGWGDALGKCLLETDFDGSKALALVGEGIKGQLQESIIQFDEPELKQATIDAKGFAKPLVDTGHMLASVDYEVQE